MFGWKQRAMKAEGEAEVARLELMMAKLRLAQYDALMVSLQKHDHFKFNSGGGIVAYNKGENEMFGHGYTWPNPAYRCELRYS